MPALFAAQRSALSSRSHVRGGHPMAWLAARVEQAKTVERLLGPGGSLTTCPRRNSTGRTQAMERRPRKANETRRIANFRIVLQNRFDVERLPPYS